MKKFISSLIALTVTMSIACLNTFAIDDNDINIDDDTIMEDTTPDPYPPTADDEIVYEDVVDEPTTEFDSDISNTDVTYDYDSLVGSEGVSNPQTGVAVPYTAVALAGLSLIYLASAIKNRNR